MSDNTTNAERGKFVFEEMYNLATSAVTAVTSDAKGKPTILINGIMGSISITKDLSSSSSNPNEKIAMIASDIIDMIVVSRFRRIVTTFIGSEVVAHFSSKEILIPFYTEYVPLADDFYSKILTEDNFFQETLNGLKNNAWDNLKYIFTDENSEVTPQSLVDGIKAMFGPSSSEPSGKTINVDKENGNIEVACLSFGEEELTEILKEVTKRDEINHITLNSQTYNIVKENNLYVRNAIDDIPKVSFLLSNILIKTGDKIDIGEYGIYNVASGDTMSEIAQRYGFTTQQLLKYNTWLIDDGRVRFNQNKVLIETDASTLNKTNHTLSGTNSEDRLIDRNGGDDTLIGNGGNDYMEGGVGFDIYKAGNGDTIYDSDGKGRVFFNGLRLSGATLNKETNKYEGNGGIYTLKGSTLTFNKDGQSVTVKNYSKSQKSLSIELKEDEEDEPLLPADMPFENNQNFSSPLILDINGDVYTTSIANFLIQSAS